MKFDISPFALPPYGPEKMATIDLNYVPDEYMFEDPRDINRVEIVFKNRIPKDISLKYMRKIWPENRVERTKPFDHPMSYGWFPVDDHFNTPWQDAAIDITRISSKSVAITFKDLSHELPDCGDYDVRFRRTMGIKIGSGGKANIEDVRIYTESSEVISKIRVMLDAGIKTPTERVSFTPHNAEILSITTASGREMDSSNMNSIIDERVFDMEIRHMKPAHPFSNDEGLITFMLVPDTFTISLESLYQEGPIWYESQGVYITLADDKTSFVEYIDNNIQQETMRDRVLAANEQSLNGAINGQPHPHPVAYSVGCKGSRHRFWIEPNGDVALAKSTVDWVPASDTERFKNDQEGRFLFGFERWHVNGRFCDPSPVIAYNIHMKNGGIMMEQKSIAVPLMKSIFDELVGDDTCVELIRFRFRNDGDLPATAELPIEYSSDSWRISNNIPEFTREKLTVADNAVYGSWHGEKVLRCTFDSAMDVSESKNGILLRRELQPGETCDAVLKIPYINLDTNEELDALSGLDYNACYQDVRRYWQEESGKGAKVITPEPRLNALYEAHPSHVHVTDFVMPNDPYLINTSVGTSTYPNFSNESCMIIQELDQRGLHDEARRRLSVWVKYQSTAILAGNFTDYDGVFYGAGGFECGWTYNQHHGWVMWYLAEHYFLTHDDEWMQSIADNLIKGADWVFRQRRNTLSDDLPHSRGFEHGFIPAGSLEDVADFYYWLSTNNMIWRGVDNAAKALEAIGHPEAARIRSEADEYKGSLIWGFSHASDISPIVRLRDGRWVPHFPSRLYRRGRDVGWIREVLEGAVYMLISGLMDPDSNEASWILDDYLDNRYLKLPYSYPIVDLESSWFSQGGFSEQPNLLAGLMPHLDRDEPEIYIWMFFNAWAACYREDIGAMVEHPSPILGFSNSAHFKTSDQANAIMWLRYMFVYANNSGLYLGRAIPREWFSGDKEISAEGVSTKYGDVSVRYKSDIANGKIAASVDLALTDNPAKTIVRIRHPEKLPIKSVSVNGKDYVRYNPLKGDIDITGINGHLDIEACY
ncbi:MAG: hypothetical protein ACYC27_18300 [Armatimonadota bacterium]